MTRALSRAAFALILAFPFMSYLVSKALVEIIEDAAAAMKIEEFRQ